MCQFECIFTHRLIDSRWVMYRWSNANYLYLRNNSSIFLNSIKLVELIRNRNNAELEGT